MLCPRSAQVARASEEEEEDAEPWRCPCTLGVPLLDEDLEQEGDGGSEGQAQRQEEGHDCAGCLCFVGQHFPRGENLCQTPSQDTRPVPWHQLC